MMLILRMLHMPKIFEVMVLHSQMIYDLMWQFYQNTQHLNLNRLTLIVVINHSFDLHMVLFAPATSLSFIV